MVVEIMYYCFMVVISMDDGLCCFVIEIEQCGED